LADALAANFLANGYTLVANVPSIADGASFGSDFVALPDYDPDVSVSVSAIGTPVATGGSGAFGVAHSAPYRIAATLTPTRTAISVNGDTVVENTFSHTGFTNVVFSFNGSTVEDVTFYPPKTNAELEALSA
jgi:hypothetical protein